MGNKSSSEYQGPKSKHWEATVAALPENSVAGKTFIVTGCTSGTGSILARFLASQGGRLLLLNRPSSRAEAALAAAKDAATSAGHDAANITHVDCDLMDFESVRSAVAAVKGQVSELDVLVNNAGIMAFRDLATKDGFDVQMQTNHLSHFLLTAELWPLLEAAAEKRGQARVVQHSSIARTRAGPDGLQAQYLEANGGNLGGDEDKGVAKGPRWMRYSQTKLANVAFCLALRDRIAQQPAGSAASKVLSFVAHPGVAYTALTNATKEDGGMSWVMRTLIPLMQQSTEDGTLGILRATLDNGIPTGSLVGPTGRKGPAVVMDAAAEEERAPPAQRQLLWELSCKATGVDPAAFLSAGQAAGASE